MIDFRQITIKDKTEYQQLLEKSSPRGCEMSFANLFLWGDQKIATVHGHTVMLSTFSKSFYPFPFGEGDKKAVIDELMADANERGIDFCITAVCENEKQILQDLYGDKFEFTTNEGSYDYVYDINDLADLPGKKYHKKRNHLRNFQKNHPDYQVVVLDKSNIGEVKDLVDAWYMSKATEENDFNYEKGVFDRAMANFDELGLVGIMIVDGGEVLAVTFASFFYPDMLDVHFEKARADVDGAYTVVNYEFARYIRQNYPQIKFLDREEDMGIEGLRKAKRSYYPHHQVIKYKAVYKKG